MHRSREVRAVWQWTIFRRGPVIADVRCMREMTVEQAIEEFRSSAIEKGDFAEPARRDNALHAAMSIAWGELEKHGTFGRKPFRSLLSDESPNVRCWVASQLLGLGDESVVPVLESLVADGGARGFNAEMVLKEWRKGRLRPPLGDSST